MNIVGNASSASSLRRELLCDARGEIEEPEHDRERDRAAVEAVGFRISATICGALATTAPTSSHCQRIPNADAAAATGDDRGEAGARCGQPALGREERGRGDRADQAERGDQLRAPRERTATRPPR